MQTFENEVPYHAHEWRNDWPFFYGYDKRFIGAAIGSRCPAENGFGKPQNVQRGQIFEWADQNPEEIPQNSQKKGEA